ncbi:MAG: hypothetical protein JKY95_08040 [Planctomycetaceae bacterium]|nr:hypothetical protein [Planctomycetaceae bacterium]
MSEQDNPDFGFLDDQKSPGDSSVLENQDSNAETTPETVPAAEEQENEAPADEPQSHAAWMDDPEISNETHDSSAKFAAALSSGDDETVADSSNASNEESSTDDQETLPSDPEEDSVTETPLEHTEVSGDLESSTQEPSDNTDAVTEQSVAEQIPEPTVSSRPQTSRGEVVPKKTFLLAVSYASAITLVCIYLVIQAVTAKPHDLESLPDLKPPMKEDEIAYRLVPEAVGLPRGHTLKIGQTRRFGNLLVTPTKVIYEPVQFVHYSGDPSITRPPSEPAMKLWLKFENVSKDQKFSPLDRQLMLTRIVDSKKQMALRSNQFLCPSSEKGNLDKTDLLFDLEMVGDWNFAGTQEETLLSPGESVELYLPSDEASYDKMQGEITWRVQFRKGYHPKSKRGVTTLIEVVFDKSDIITS